MLALAQPLRLAIGVALNRSNTRAFHVSCMVFVSFLMSAILQGISRPTRVTAAGSTGVASGTFDIETEDTITLLVEWENLADDSK